MTSTEFGITITFGDCIENHVGMEIIGDKKTGYNYNELINIYQNLLELNFDVELINLHSVLPIEEQKEENLACVLIIKNFLNKTFIDNENIIKSFIDEHKFLNYDEKYFDTRRKKVFNKHARKNILFGDINQEPKYEEKKGRIINFNNVPLLKEVRSVLPKLFTNKANNLLAESNYYFDLTSTYIGFHGDRERNIVIGLRLGNSFNLYYQWYLNSEKKYKMIKLNLQSGDLYIMSDKAVGNDWRKRRHLTLRHAAFSDCLKHSLKSKIL